MSSLDFPPGVDVVASSGRFPVVESVALEPIRHRIFRRARRSPRSLPMLDDGSVLVFGCNGDFSLAPPGPRMLSSDVVIRATTVHVVLIRGQEIPAVVELPSVINGRRAVLRASYVCKVHDAVRVLEEGVWDASIKLRQYLLDDVTLQMLAARVDMGDNSEVSQRIFARLLARHKLEPPMIPGMDVKPMGVHIGQIDQSWKPPSPRTGETNGHHNSGGGFRPTGRDRYDDDGRPPRDGYGTAPEGDD